MLTPGAAQSSPNSSTLCFLLPQPQTPLVGWAKPRPAGEVQGRAARGLTAQHGLTASARAGNKPPAKPHLWSLCWLLQPGSAVALRVSQATSITARQDGRPWAMLLAGNSQYMQEESECPKSALPRQGTAAPGMAEPARSWARFSLMLPCLTSAAGPFQQDVMHCQGHAAEPTLAGLWHPLAWAEDRE